LNRLADFREISQEGDATEDYLNVPFLNAVPSTIPKWQTSEVDAMKLVE
jgi:hypothetical protein